MVGPNVTRASFRGADGGAGLPERRNAKLHGLAGAGHASHDPRTLRGAGALEVDLSWGQRAAAAALEPRALSLAAGPRWFLAALAPRVWQPRRGLSLQARRRRPAADQGS
jgi:hypothetical protein